MALKWFTPKTYASLSEAFTAIKAEIQALQPINTHNVKWRQDSTGMRAELTNLGISGSQNQTSDSDETLASASEYSGDFKVIRASDTEVKVVLGSNPAATTHVGYYEHGIQRIAVTKPSAITVTATGFIYVTITYTTAYVFTFAFGTTLPASANGSIVRKLADVTFTDGKITAITQAQQGILITPGVF